VNPNWRQVGSLRLADTPERVEEFKLMEKVAKEAGLEMGFISASEAKQKWPSMQFENAKAILWCPSDGYLQPYDLSMTYRHYARKMGVKFYTSCNVENIELSPANQVKSVTTNRGTIKCDTVVNAAGSHAYHIAKLVGLELPIIPVRHEYFVTEPLAGGLVQPSMPVLRIPDRSLYVRADVNSVLCGGWEPQAWSLNPKSYKLNEEPPLIPEDWNVLGKFSSSLVEGYYPPVQSAGLRTVFNGWPTFTPDGRFIIGKTKRVGGFVMAGGCNAHGVSGSAGIGKYVLESMVEKNPSDYVKSLSPDRFLDSNWNWSTAEEQSRGIYQTYYDLIPQFQKKESVPDVTPQTNSQTGKAPSKAL